MYMYIIRYACMHACMHAYVHTYTRPYMCLVARMFMETPTCPGLPPRRGGAFGPLAQALDFGADA